MANIAYEIAVRFGTIAYLLSRTERHAEEPAEREMAAERLRPLSSLHLNPGRRVYWLHAVSMGEIGVADVLVREIKRQAPDSVAVISTATAPGFEAAKQITGADAVVAARFDTRNLVSTMFDAICPAAIVLVEGDLWHNMIAIARRRGIPVFVANAKLSERSLGFYRRFPVYSRTLFSRIARVYAQTETYLERFAEAGLSDDGGEVAGNVKLDTIAPTPSGEEIAEIADAAGCAGADSVVTFGSLHPGEEIPAIRGMQRVWENHPGAHCLIAPRHIEKTSQFLESIRREFGLDCSIYSEGSGAMARAPEESASPRITIINKMGLLMKLYALADIGVVGGTFIDGVGGHNLTEPAFYGKPVVYGPYIYKQRGLHDLIAAYDAGRQSTEETFPNVLAALVNDCEMSRRLGSNGWRMVEESRGVAARVVSDILQRVLQGQSRSSA